MDRIAALVITASLIITISSILNINNNMNSLDKKDCCSCSIQLN